LQIGMSSTLMPELPEAFVLAGLQPMRSLIEAQTGRKADISVVKDPQKLAQQVTDGKVTLAVFAGYEFAWTKVKHPQLRPLVIAINQQRQQYAHLVVRQDSQATGFSSLKNQALGLATLTREHCRLFVERHAQSCGKDSCPGRIATPASEEEALDEVVDGTIQAAVIDGAALECYQRRKPGRFTQLKELVKSEAFPATVIVYRAGSLDDATLRQYREGLLTAKQTARGRQVLLLSKLTGFETVPNDFDQTLASIGKAYPPPGAMK
jgi:ABC-type phosphate/phosphonate transport system substrate-binding protein